MRSHSWNKSVFNTKYLLALFAAATLCAACGDDDDDGAAGSGGTAGGGMDAGGQGAADSGATDSGVDTGTEADEDAGAEGATIHGIIFGTEGKVVPGVDVCWYGETSVPCVTTDGSGNFALAGLTENEWGAISMEVDGYPYNMYWLLAYERPLHQIVLWDNERYSEFYSETGEIEDETKGFVYAKVYNTVLDRAKGALVSIDPMSGAGPYYTGAEDHYDPEATSTSDGTPFFTNVDPGIVRVTVTLDGFPCENFVTGGHEPKPVDIEVVPNTVAGALFTCTSAN